MRRNVALFLTGLFVLFGFWLGEGGLPFWATLPIVGGVLGCLAVALIVSGTVWLKVLTGVAALILYVVALLSGSYSFDQAYNECVARGEEIRVLLRKYHRSENRYPDRLEQLAGVRICGRIIHPTILEYERKKDGYVLSFKDWLVEHTASESEPFTAHK